MNYLELSLNFDQKNPWNEIAIAQLSEANFDGFEITQQVLLAYIEENKFEKSRIDSLFKEWKKKTNFQHVLKKIPNKNWNEVWESSFDPVVIENKLHIIAPFHEIPQNADTIVKIEPKMSFGTGHHPTTHLMCKQILKTILTGKKVLDMGAGTGILSILCEKCGSKDILAIELEEGAFNNLNENIVLNECKAVDTICGSFETIPSKTYDFIFANINKNVLTQNFHYFKSRTESGDFLIISGFLISDRNELLFIASQNNFEIVSEDSLDEWLLLKLKKI